MAAALVLAACVVPATIEGSACDEQHPCPFGFACQAGTCRALSGGITFGCKTDSDCDKGVCLEAVGICAQCEVDSDCPFSSCLQSSNTCGCDGDEDCLTFRCNAEISTCVSCYADEQCASGACDVDSGICQPPADTHGGAW